jgi:hypothetical protein
MKRTRRNVIVGFAAAIATLGVADWALRGVVAQQGELVEAPRFEVDPAFPKPLPNNWLMGMTIGIGVDAQDHIWIVHRPDTLSAAETAADQTPPTGACCSAAPPVLEFDQQGNLLRHWGGPGQG